MPQGRMVILGDGDRPQTVLNNTTLKVSKGTEVISLCTFEINDQEVKILIGKDIKRKIGQDGSTLPDQVAVSLKDNEVILLDEFKLKLLPLDNSSDLINWKVYEVADMGQDIELSIEQVIVDKVIEERTGDDQLEVERNGSEIKVPSPAIKKEVTRSNLKLAELMANENSEEAQKLRKKKKKKKKKVAEAGEHRTQTGVRIKTLKKTKKVRKKVNPKKNKTRSDTLLLFLFLIFILLSLGYFGYLDPYLALVPGFNDFFGQ